jgi:antitoxin HicB
LLLLIDSITFPAGALMNRAKFDLDAYPFQIRLLSKDDGGGFLIEYPDVPGCTSDGETPEEAMKNGRDALRSALRTLREFGDPVPRPGSFGASSGQWRQRVPKSLHARLEARTAQEGVSLNTLVTALLAEGLEGRRSRAS